MATSHGVISRVSFPMLASSPACPCTARAIRSGSVAHRPRHAMRPVVSPTQIAVCPCETSKPKSRVIEQPPICGPPSDSARITALRKRQVLDRDDPISTQLCRVLLGHAPACIACLSRDDVAEPGASRRATTGSDGQVPPAARQPGPSQVIARRPGCRLLERQPYPCSPPPALARQVILFPSNSPSLRTLPRASGLVLGQPPDADAALQAASDTVPPLVRRIVSIPRHSPA